MTPSQNQIRKYNKMVADVSQIVPPRLDHINIYKSIKSSKEVKPRII